MDTLNLKRLERLLDLHVRWRLPFSASVEHLALIPEGGWPRAASPLTRLTLMLERWGILLRVERERASFLPLPRSPVHLEWAAWHHYRLRALVGGGEPPTGEEHGPARLAARCPPESPYRRGARPPLP